jgi:CBS domain-containing protein
METEVGEEAVMVDETNIRRARDVMTGPIIRVTPWTDAREAGRLATESAARHVLVFEAEALLGTACICAIRDAPRATPVSARMKRPAYAVSGSASVTAAAALMRDRSLSCLPVVDAGLFVGVLTLEDLVRAGVPESELNRRRCASCGSAEHVRAEPRGGATRFCVDCLELARSAEWHEDLGGGG